MRPKGQGGSRQAMKTVGNTEGCLTGWQSGNLLFKTDFFLTLVAE
jgi:hypothetical protein